jgi:O-antigen/teichoic acid export membrane protein
VDTDLTAQQAPDILDSSSAGHRVIRGTAARTAGHFIGLALLLIAAPLLTRHLGVTDYGSYVVVGSLITIAMVFADAGLGTAAVTEYAVRDASGRRRLMETLVTARLVTSAISGLGIVVFALVAGYEPVLVLGTALGSAGLVLTMLQQTYVIPLGASLRLELTTALGILRQAITVLGILLLIAFGGDLLAFYVLPIPVGVAVLGATLVAVRTYGGLRPRINHSEWRYLIREAPAAATSLAGALFYRIAIVMTSLLATAQQTGYFGVSLQIVEVFITVAVIIGGSALPILSRAADKDRQRLAVAFRQLFDVSVILGLGTAFVLVVGAEPIIAFIGGSEFAPAVPILRIQGLAVALTFLVMLFSYMLWALRARRQLIVCNLAGVCAAIALIAVLAPLREAKGAAVAMLISEFLLLSCLAVALLWSRPDLWPSLRTTVKALVAIAIAAAFAFMPISRLLAVTVGATAYLIVLVVLRAFPRDAWSALLRRRP